VNGDGSLNQSAPRVADGHHPISRFLIVETKVFLESIEGFKRSKRRLSSLVGLKDGEQTGAFFGEPFRSFCHDLPVIDLNLQR